MKMKVSVKYQMNQYDKGYIFLHLKHVAQKQQTVSPEPNKFTSSNK